MVQALHKCFEMAMKFIESYLPNTSSRDGCGPGPHANIQFCFVTRLLNPQCTLCCTGHACFTTSGSFVPRLGTGSSQLHTLLASSGAISPIGFFLISSSESAIVLSSISALTAVPQEQCTVVILSLLPKHMGESTQQTINLPHLTSSVSHLKPHPLDSPHNHNYNPPSHFH